MVGSFKNVMICSCVNRYIHVYKSTKLGYQSRCLLILPNVQPGGHKNATVILNHLQENIVLNKASAYLIIVKCNSDENISGSEIMICLVGKPYVLLCWTTKNSMEGRRNLQTYIHSWYPR